MRSFNSFAKRVFQYAVLLPSITLCNIGVCALELGELSVHSRLGSHFYAEVQLIDNADDHSPAEECFHLSNSGGTESSFPELIHGRISIERKNRKRKLIISSVQPINDPVLQITIRVGCGAEVIRNYTVLIDPAKQEPFSETDQATTRPLLKELMASNLRGATRTKLSSEQKSEERTANRLHISDDSDTTVSDSERPLQTSTELSIDLSTNTSESTRALLREEYKLLSTYHALAEQQLVLDEQVRNLETGLKKMGSVTESSSPSSALPIPLASTEIPKPQKNENTNGWLEILIILGLISALIWALLHRTRKQKHYSSHNNILKDTKPRNNPEKNDLSAEERDSPAQASIVDSEPKTVLGDAWIPPPEVNEHVLHAPSLRSIEIEETDDSTTAIELAEIMIAFGRVKGAIQSLEEFLALKPNAAVAPWLKLLEIYRTNDMREEFESCSKKLKSHFDTVPVSWEEPGEPLKSPLFQKNSPEV